MEEEEEEEEEDIEKWAYVLQMNVTKSRCVIQRHCISNPAFIM